MTKFTITLFFLLLSNFIYAQTGTLKVIVTLNEDIAAAAQQLYIHGYLAKGSGRLTDDLKPRDFEFKSGKLEYTIDSLLASAYSLVISGNYNRSSPGTVYSYYLGSRVDTNIVITENTTTVLKLAYPPNCAYHRHFNNKTCSRCHKSDLVVPISYGDLIIDPIADSTAESHYLLQEPTGCDPSWYCKRDDVLF